ncbi:related to PBP2 - PAB1 binding protein [Melanopsichium pennsylvanicum]|uniref:Related to PBP2 - PAB1 binding protein n=2 Tax=Melanopsichium pennsylvanicum TaxID=63383 RepID=A0AAJ4XJR9_9BASI|nr:related to PBP2-PAB1 binding protein [Melanopsichium pennsylvanicum 4]SNX83644.1 related to PBP2 - PAB1 binding protein [Melanopsichium pennsylvanicum]
MSEVAKRQRDTSSTPEPEAKRPNVEAESEPQPDTTATTDEDAPASPDHTATENMASDSPVKPVSEEKDAVDLGSGATADATSSSDNKADNGSVSNGADGDQVAGSAGSVGDSSETQATQISMRTLIVTSDASIIIGKSGKHINEIRDKSNARLNISEIIPGNPERILTVSGPLDAVSKAFGLIVRRINDEPFDQPSVPGSKSVTIRFIVPNSRMGSVIGKQGSKIKEIQEASGARLTAGEAMLPGSTERVLSISGVADAVHIAVYYVGTILLEHQDRNANNLPYRPTAGGSSTRPPVPGANPYAVAQQQPFGYGAPAPAPFGAAPPAGGAPQLPPGSQTQQIFIPNDLVGCIIGKGGSKINEIRSMSASHIKIMEPGAGIAAGGSGNERLVTITGPPPNIQMAVSLLYQRLEQEKMRLAQGGAP